MKSEYLNGYKKLKVYQKAHKLAVEIHKMTLQLPKFEQFEQSSQIRRSSKSICANIVEGFALRNYKQEFIHYLYRAYASCEETMEHLELLGETESLADKNLSQILNSELNELSRMLKSFVQSVETMHKSKK